MAINRNAADAAFLKLEIERAAVRQQLKTQPRLMRDFGTNAVAGQKDNLHERNFLQAAWAEGAATGTDFTAAALFAASI